MPSSIVRAFRQGHTLAVSLPRPYREALGISAGAELRIEVIDGRIVLTPLERAIRERLERAGRLPLAPGAGPVTP